MRLFRLTRLSRDANKLLVRRFLAWSHRRRWVWAIWGLVLVCLLQSLPSGQAASATAIKMGRPTWDTGWFQAEVYRALLIDLGYRVDVPQTLSNDDFYTQAAAGEVDLWASGWFPLHNRYLEQPEILGKVEPVGFEVPGGALQGYLVDKATAERLNILTLADLLRPEVIEAFDRDQDGRADLLGCNQDWACAEVIDYHLREYGLSETVEHIQGDYAPLMEAIVERQRQGESVLFYTWTPNWTVNALVPDEDVVWLEVPYPSLPLGQKSLESETTMTGITGCVADPCTLGFPRNDIRAVANREFLATNPAVRSLLEQVTIPLADITTQNAKMLAGEGDETDLQDQAQAWIEANRELVNSWLMQARAIADIPPIDVAAEAAATAAAAIPLSTTPLRVVTQRFEPFVIYEDQQYQGFSIDLWEAIADELQLSYDLVGVNSVAKLLDEVERGAADLAIAGIGITSQREERLDFSYPYYESGLQVLVPSDQSELSKLLSVVGAVLRSPRLYYGVGILVVILLIVAHILWWSERTHNDEFPETYWHGIWEAFWWAAVTVTTVGYGDKVPQKPAGRVFGLLWMFSGYFVFAYFTASIATTFTVQELQGVITGLEDLPGKRVATVAESAAAEFLDQQTNLLFQDFPTLEALYTAVETEQTVDAVVYDAPVLQYFVSHQGQGKYQVVGEVFQSLNYGIALQPDSPYREAINATLLKLYEAGRYEEIYQEWFG
ncbi:glycine betaine/L-proline ABC transporter substrate-binding protein ProX [Halomicronema sp. CCY15110]|uniref:glycine betaine/L-proline ABC transporter substrate-binding protein ProX n=1 Tax=Halomicronema sp. CCY15110 TaxID=2767773 RepID=UPI001950C4B9|nr:glycine betaine/L-proline ABC transporter substrate-binding protein ProX [Halomicronema sp. CCY15110]